MKKESYLNDTDQKTHFLQLLLDILPSFRDDLTKLTYTTCFIKETMRMYTPVPSLTRKLSEPVTVQGVRFPPGCVIDLHPHLLHHNPDVWENHKVGYCLNLFTEHYKYIKSLISAIALTSPLTLLVKTSSDGRLFLPLGLSCLILQELTSMIVLLEEENKK